MLWSPHFRARILISAPLAAQSPASSVHVTPNPKGRMRSSQNLSAQREAGSSARSPEWVLTSPRSFGSIKDGKVTLFAHIESVGPY